MTEIDIRELEAHASRIVREVREHRAQYTVTDRGNPAALLLPVGDVVAETAPEVPGIDSSPDGRAAWEELERLGAEIGRGWKAKETSAEILSSMRR